MVSGGRCELVIILEQGLESKPMGGLRGPACHGGSLGFVLWRCFLTREEPLRLSPTESVTGWLSHHQLLEE